MEDVCHDQGEPVSFQIQAGHVRVSKVRIETLEILENCITGDVER